MSYKIVIPSYKRVDILRTHTLNFLKNNNIPNDIIFIFVVPEEYDLYSSNFPDYNIICGVPGLKEQRNYISQYFPKGEYLFSIDDDIKDIIIKKNNDFISLTELRWVVLKGFSDCIEFKSNIFGFYPVYNKGWMTDTVSHNFKFIIGSAFGFINNPEIVRTISEKDDYDFTVLNFIKDKIVIRYNYISIKTYYYKTKGGLQQQSNRLEEQEKAVSYLLDKYPKYFGRKRNSKTGYPELRIKILSS